MDMTSFICPQTRAPLTLQGDALTGGARPYPIVDGLPRFVAMDNYAAAFGLQWNTYARTQLDSYTGTTITEDRLAKALPFPLAELRGKRVLEAGCGAGRFTEVLLKYGAILHSFDLSSAVSANFSNNGAKPGVTVFQADINAIPLPEASFDVVLCLGVVQHTPDTAQAVASLYRMAKPGGVFVYDHYKWHLGNFTSLYLPWWFIIKQLDEQTQLKVTEGLTAFFFPLHWRFKDNELVQKVLRRVSPINFYYGRYDLPSKELHYEWSMLDTHDRNTDHFKRHWTQVQMSELCESLGAKPYTVEVGGTGHLCRMFKPAE